MQDLSLHILDVAENGVRAGADLIKITIEENRSADRLTITIEDNGRGMASGFLAQVLDPFVTTRTTRKVGLGLSMFQQAAREAQGDLKVESNPGQGIKVSVFMSYSHIDRKPMGNMADSILALIEGNPAVDFVYVHKKGGREYILDTRDIRLELEEIPINNPQVIGVIRDNILSGLHEIVSD
jgi:Histidine kinase-, DNA gyrase B-, and HSP90-like ATPase